ncbi:hypothetical protein N7481_013085 [Penicillium waksmanii]|uniref:uncharacterized protein n=1 Tax=Penicillium waksmanii TaxID=69791 RepID=UPI002548BD6F|nr:uncharacterized protein N7481_013085 [Penicillium waksmanii]KAJ5966371.1 hypothetical protein N7481_013085 [Penicillium waksmanii]
MVTVLRTPVRVLSLEVMSAIYYDLRDACYFPKIVQGKPEQIDWTMYENMNACTSNFIAEAFAQVGHQLSLDQQNRTGRMYIALDRLQWKIFAICAHSKAFRNAIQSVNSTDWDSILALISQEKRSIETFARSRDLDWRGPLLPYAGDPWPGLQEALTPDINLATGHPHHIVQTEDGGLRQPVFPWTEDGELQPNMHGNFLHPSFPNETAVASKRNENFRECFLCRKNTCKCKPMFVPADFIELREYAGKGPPLIELTVGDHFAKIVAEHGDRTASAFLPPSKQWTFWSTRLTVSSSVVSKHQNDRVTYASLDARSNAFARGLESVPLNPSFNATQVVSALSHLEASHLIISAESNLPRKDPRSNVKLLELMVEDLFSSKLQSALIPSLERIILVNNSSGRVDISSYKSLTPFSSVMSQLPGDCRPLPGQNLSPQDIVNIQFTSGTTAMPKAACLSHHSILNNGSQIGDRMLLTPNDIVCCPPPMFHCFGSILGYMATATHGSSIVFPSESFNARAALQAVQEEKCTALYGVPTMFLEELGLIASGEVSGDGFQQLRTGIAAGSSIPAELMKKLHKVLNLTELTICYGMTETSPVSAMTATDDPISKRISTVGRLMPHVEAKIVDPVDKTQTLPIGTRGELAVSGYLLMKEYWGDPVKTAEVMIADATGKMWMHTGDEASISEDGYVSITGRIKDLIIRGGENIHPLEIENCLLAHPGVIDVSVVGVPDERYGEVVASFISARDQGSKMVTAEEIQQWVREHLSNHLAPKYVFFLDPTETFPKTASGKIQKFKLKEQAIKLIAGA